MFSQKPMLQQLGLILKMKIRASHWNISFWLNIDIDDCNKRILHNSKVAEDNKHTFMKLMFLLENQ